LSKQRLAGSTTPDARDLRESLYGRPSGARKRALDQLR